MSDEKTIPPSQKRLEDARKQGSGPFSSDLVSALFLFYALLYFNFMPVKKLISATAVEIWSTMHSGVIDGKILHPLLPLLGFFLLFSAGAISVLLAGNALQGKTGLKREKKIAIKQPGRVYLLFYNCCKCALLMAAALLLYTKEVHIFSYLLSLTGVFFVLSTLDFFYRRWHFQKSLWMTPEEAKQERRESGDRAIHAERGRRS